MTRCEVGLLQTIERRIRDLDGRVAHPFPAHELGAPSFRSPIAEGWESTPPRFWISPRKTPFTSHARNRLSSRRRRPPIALSTEAANHADRVFSYAGFGLGN